MPPRKTTHSPGPASPRARPRDGKNDVPPGEVTGPDSLTILLDIGGVLVDVRRDLAHSVWTRQTGLPPERFDTAVFGAGRKDAFDRGLLSPEAFFAAAAEDAGDEALAPAIRAAYEAILVPRNALAAPLDALRGRVRLGVFSNIDPVHAQKVLTAPLFEGRFSVTVLSYETGHRKPEPGAFEAALAAVGAGDAFLLDDRADVVAAARPLGLPALQVPNLPRLVAALTWISGSL